MPNSTGAYTLDDVSQGEAQKGQFSIADVAPPDSQDAVKQKYGLPANVDLEKTYTDTIENAKSNYGNFAKAYSEYQASKPQPKGFWQNLYGEAKNLFKSLSAEPTVMGAPDAAYAAMVAQNPVNAIPGASVVSARAKQAKTDPLGAVGSSITDALAMAGPLILGRFVGPEAGELDEAAAVKAGGEEKAAGEAAAAANERPGIRLASPTPGSSAPTVAPAASPTPAASPGIRTTPFSPEPGAPTFAARLGIVDGPFEDMLTRAIKPGKNNTKWQSDVALAKTDLLNAEQDLGHPIGDVDDLISAANTAKKSVWKEYEAKVAEAKSKASNAPSLTAIDGNKIADAMVNSLDARTRLQNPEMVARVQKVADTYRRPMSLDEAEDFLQSINNDLHSYYAKNKVNQQVAAKDPSMAPTVAEGNELRNQLYSTLDNLTGPGAADIKKRYGALSNIENEAIGRKNVAARQQPQSLAEQIGMARAAGKIAVGVMRASPATVLEGSESLAAAKWLKERNTTDSIIGRAFDKARGEGEEPVRTTAFSPAAVPAAALASLGVANAPQQQQQ